jgi:putative nucleotidyltransferase with HDIG domain
MSYSPLSSRLERLYFGCVITVGSLIAGLAAADLFYHPVRSQWMVFGALTLLTGSFTIRIPKLSIRISVSDAFVFASVLSFGTSVATVIVAVDSIVATLWMRRANRSVFRSAFNLSVASLSIWVASTVFHRIADPLPTPPDVSLSTLLGPLAVLAGLYFLLNSWMIAVALAFEQRTRVTSLWWKHFPWFSLNYFGGASAAGLLYSYTNSVDFAAVSIILPLLVISYLTYRTSLGRVDDAQRHLEQMNELYISTIEALAMAVDAKDQITHGHIRRVQIYAVELAKRLGVRDGQQLSAIETAALLHDMGKLAIPEHILNKPGKLTPAEFERMKRHTDIGADLLSSIKFPYPVVPIVRHHHENWNGTGYPTGIAGTDIPLGARILSVVDCFDALTSDRPYRPRLSDQEAFDILRERRGSMYDPLVVDSFIAAHSEIAPTAIRAGQEARSMMAGDSLAQNTGSEGQTSFAQIRSNAFESAVIAEFQRRLATTSTPDAVIEEAAIHLRQLTPATVFALYRYNVELDAVVCDAVAGDTQGLIKGVTIRVGEKVTGWCAANHRTSLNSHAYLDLGPLSESFQPNLRSTISTPISRHERVAAVLSGYSPKPEAFSETHRYVFEHVAALIADRLWPRQTLEKTRGTVVAFRGTP